LKLKENKFYVTTKDASPIRLCLNHRFPKTNNIHVVGWTTIAANVRKVKSEFDYNANISIS